MTLRKLWEPCITNYGRNVVRFIEQHISKKKSDVVFIGGVGFDPRSTLVASMIATTKAKRSGVLIRENRGEGEGPLSQKGKLNFATMTACFPDHQIAEIQIIGEDGAIIGGREAIQRLNGIDFTNATDVIVDISALSISVSFPIIKYLYEKRVNNLHVLVTHNATMDEMIIHHPVDRVSYIHGFKGGMGLSENEAAARLWLPQLAMGSRDALNRIYNFIEPHDTCPILPFPSENPRRGDELLFHFMSELESSWDVDSRNILYAAEDDPLDLYRLILRLGERRAETFHECGGSMLVLSPLGSKLMALGTLLAALEKDIPLVYLEALRFDVDAQVFTTQIDKEKLFHLWLDGYVYKSPPDLSKKVAQA